VATPPIQSRARRRIPLLPTKRLLAIDPGSHCLKLMVVAETFGRIRVRYRELVEIQSSGLVSEEEVMRHAQDLVREQGEDPVALALPHERALSQLVDLPPSDAAEARRLIEEETVKLSGLGESSIVFDYAALKPFGQHRNPYWVTLCREEEVQRQVGRCGLGHLDLCEVTTTANALAAAYLTVEPRAWNAVLVDFGAAGTTVVIVHQDQVVEAAHFAIGGDALTEAVSMAHGCSIEVAESTKRGLDLTGGAAGALTGVLDEWSAELNRVLTEWVHEHKDMVSGIEQFDVILCGGGSLQPGLAAYLNRAGGMRFGLWPGEGRGAVPGPRFAVAYGAAIQALGRSRQPVSLLPVQVRQFWRGHHAVSLLHSLIVFLLAMSVLVLGFGTWQKRELEKSKVALLEQSKVALEKARTIEDLSLEVRRRYERLRPGLERQQATIDALQGLALLRQVRDNQSFWFVLFADVPSYVAARPWGETNAPVPVAVGVQPTFPVREGFVAEVCVPEQGESMRRTLSQLVSDMRRTQLYSNVDLLPADRRRPVVDSALVLPEQHFALAMELPPDRIPELSPLPDRRPGTNAIGGQRRVTGDEPRTGDKAPSGVPLRQP
jgi:Tfp pilus assembly PilM family ATPase